MAKDREYEKQVRAYVFFIVQDGKAVSGWEYAEDAKDELRAMKEEGRLGDAKIVARARLAKHGIDPARPFAAASAAKHESGGNPRLKGGEKTDIRFHTDGAVSIWDVYSQSRVRTKRPSDQLLASLSSGERDRVERHVYADRREALLEELKRASVQIADPVVRENRIAQLSGGARDMGATTSEIRKAAQSAPSAKKHESGGNPRTTARASSGRTLEFHVYAPDGFESAHRTFEGARRAAQRGASARRMEFKVYRTSATGFTGVGHGTEVATLLGDVKLKSRIKKLVG